MLDLFAIVTNGLALSFQIIDDQRNGFVDAALEVHRIGTCCHHFQSFADDGLSQHGSGGGSVAGDVGCLGGNLFHHLRSHVLDGIFQFNFFGNGYAVLGYGGGTEFFLDHHIAAFGAQGDFHGVGQRVHAFFHFISGFDVEEDLFCHDIFSLNG